MIKKYTKEQDLAWQATLPKKKVAVKVVVRSDKGNVLLVKPDYKNTWQMPGGGVDASENPVDAAVREVKEETNIKVRHEDLKIIGTVFKPNEDYLFLIYEYVGTVSEDSDYTVEDEEIEEYKFYALDAVANMLPDYYSDFWSSYSS